MPTENQKQVFKNVVNKVRKGAKISISKEMRNAGYSKRTAEHPSKITKSIGWQELLATIDEKPLIDRLREISLDKDKRASIAAIQELFKIKDRYPANKIKLTAFDERDKVVEIIDNTLRTDDKTR